jgi:N-methylhydantoinase B
MKSKVDPVLAELLRSQLLSALEDMGKVLSRNAVSSEIVQEKDYANAVLFDKGEVVMLDNPLCLGTATATAAVMQDLFQFAMKPGDVILSNDPYSGGTHVQDFTLLTPFFHGRERICFILCRAHLPDIGGQVPGGYYPFADDVWAEGSRIPPLKIVQEGKPVGDKLDTIIINSRCSDDFDINLRAMLAALETGRSRLQGMLEKHGKNRLREGMQHCLDIAESQLRSKVTGWSKGDYEGISVLDHDARGQANLKVKANIHFGERVVVDLTQSSSQSAGFVNSSRANTLSYALLPFYSLLSASIPINSALLRVIDVVTAEGTIVHPRFPAAVGWGPYHIGAEIVSAVAQALGKAFPKLAAVLVPKFFMLRAHLPEEPVAFPLHTFLLGGSPGAHGVDGWGSPGPFSRSVTPSVEMVESNSQILLRRLELLPNSAGTGEWRGGFGTVAEFEFTGRAVVDAVVEGQNHPSEPLAGGTPGAPNSIQIGSDKPVQGLVWECDVSSKVIIAQMGGGGGWGDVREREPEAVALDAENGLVTESGTPNYAAHSTAIDSGHQREQT